MGWRNAIVKLIFGLVLGISIALLTAFNVLLAWVATGPRSLDMLSPYLEIAFEPPDHKYSVSIGETWLIWDGWKHPIDIRLRNVKVLTSERHTYSRFREISLGLDLLGLMQGHILPTSLTITHPVISLFQNEDRSVSFGIQPEAQADASQPAAEVPAVPFAALVAPFINPDEHSPLRAMRLVSIVNADLILSNKSKGVFFKASGADLTLKHNHEGLRAFAGAKIAYGNYTSVISADFVKPQKSSLITGEVDISQLMPGTLADLFADDTLLSAMKFPVSGTIRLQADMDGAVQEAGFILDGGQGTLETDKLDGVVPVRSLHVDGKVGHTAENNASMLKINALTADLNGPVLETSGVVSLAPAGPEVHARVTAKNVPAQDVHMLWPPGLAPKTREWVTANILEGTITSAQAQLNIAAGDTAKPDLPQQDIDALVELQDAKIRYMSGHPEVTGVKGSVRIDGKMLDASIESGHYMQDTKLSEGRVLIEDLNPDNPLIKVSFTADSNAHDAIKLLELPPLKKAQKLNLQADTATGTLKGRATLGFHFFAPRDAAGRETEDDVDYDVVAEVAGMSQAGFMNRFDVKGASGALKVNNSELSFKGAGEVNGASVSDAAIRYLFTPGQKFDTFIDATAIAPVESLPRFGYPAFDFLKGELGVKASMKDGKSSQSTQGSIDLTNAAVTVPTLHVTKPAKEAATLDITAEKQDGVSSIPSFHFKSHDIDAQGAVDLSGDMASLRRVHVNNIIAGNTKLSELLYEHDQGAYVLNVRGDSLDLSPWMGKKDEKGSSDFSFEHFPALQLQADVGHVLFDTRRELHQVKGTLSCDATHCESASMNGLTSDNKPFAFRILRNPKGKRQLSLHAQSAGVFLKDLNVFDGMEGGDLTITGNYTEATAEKGSSLKGHLDINEHAVKDAPVLARILTLASLTGIFDTMQGKGIAFARLSVPFTISNDVITVENAKTHGDALGLTADGTITFPKGTLDLQGTIVPAYSVNHVLGNVPLIGSVLTGGEGQGVFAARYSVKGTQDNPDVSVNPLAILTPGFLRGLFDILDAPKKEEDDDDSQ